MNSETNLLIKTSLIESISKIDILPSQNLNFNPQTVAMCFDVSFLFTKNFILKPKRFFSGAAKPDQRLSRLSCHGRFTPHLCVPASQGGEADQHKFLITKFLEEIIYSTMLHGNQ